MSELELVADALAFPTSVAFAADGAPLVAESGVGLGGAPSGGHVLRLGRTREVLVEGLHAPVNGLTVHDGDHPDRRRRAASADPERPPGPGQLPHENDRNRARRPTLFRSGRADEHGIVGLDAYEIGWLRRLPHAHDVPGHDLLLTGVNAPTPDPINGAATAETGAFRRFGTRSRPGEGSQPRCGARPP